MAKLNVNTATREELVEAAGLRAELADAILKFRGKHGGKITDVNALEEIPGVGPATVEQLRKALDFSERKADENGQREKAGNGNGQGERAGNGSERQAQESARVAKETTEKVADAAASTTRRVADAGREVATAGAQAGSAAARSGLQLVQRSIGSAGEVQRETARQSTEGAAEIGKLWVDLLNEQTRHNMQLAMTLGQAINWDEVVQLQSEFIRASFERLNQLNSRYLEVFQAVARSTGATAERQGRDAA